MLSESILEAIKRKAEKKYAEEFHQQLCIHIYKDAIEMMLGFQAWVRDVKYIWHEKNEVYYAAWDNYEIYTTIQLLEKYLEDENAL